MVLYPNVPRWCVTLAELEGETDGQMDSLAEKLPSSKLWVFESENVSERDSVNETVDEYEFVVD